MPRVPTNPLPDRGRPRSRDRSERYSSSTTEDYIPYPYTFSEESGEKAPLYGSASPLDSSTLASRSDLPLPERRRSRDRSGRPSNNTFEAKRINIPGSRWGLQYEPPRGRSRSGSPRYRALDPARFEIRLLQILPEVKDELYDQSIKCQLVTRSLVEKPQYHALSYCWGNSISERSILINENPFPVTRSLEDAMLELRRREVAYVWIDFICINQDDQDERGRQVLLMDRIFGSAITVFAWLGSAPPHADLVLQILEECSKGRSLGQDLSDSLKSLLRRLLSDLCDNPYWKRIWIIQELAKAADILFIWGQHEFRWDMLMAASKSKDFLEIVSIDARDVLTALREFRSREQQIYTNPQRESLLNALVHSRRSLATDGRDKLFAILNLTSDGRDVVPFPNYSQSVLDIYVDAAYGIIVRQRKFAAILLARTTQPYSTDLPSWVPDWAILGNTLIPEWILEALREPVVDMIDYDKVTGRGTELRIDCKFEDTIMTFLDTYFSTENPSVQQSNIPYDVKCSSIQFVVALYNGLVWHTSEPDSYTFAVHLQYHGNFYVPDKAPYVSAFARVFLESYESKTLKLFRDLLDTNQHLTINGSSIKETLQEFLNLQFHGSDSLKEQDTAHITTTVVNGFDRLRQNNMRLAITKGLQIRPVFYRATKGDDIVYVPSCPLSIILRRLGDRYNFVGEVWEPQEDRPYNYTDMEGQATTTVTII